MDTHFYFICIGSNTNPVENMELARRELHRHFPGISFGEEMTTEPFACQTNPARFRNQTGWFRSAQDKETVKGICKQIERQAGRTVEDKTREIVKLDIDLIRCDAEILKPEDLERPYLKACRHPDSTGCGNDSD